MAYIVYGLTDPFSDNEVFYVGVTKNLPERLRQHNCTRYHGNPSFDRVNAIRMAGARFGCMVLWQDDDKKIARIKERQLILSTPGLVNSKDPRAMTSHITHHE